MLDWDNNPEIAENILIASTEIDKILYVYHQMQNDDLYNRKTHVEYVNDAVSVLRNIATNQQFIKKKSAIDEHLLFLEDYFNNSYLTEKNIEHSQKLVLDYKRKLEYDFDTWAI